MFGKILLTILVLGVLFVGITLGGQYCEKRATEPPDVNEAKYIVRTMSRVYYTNDYDWNGNDLILNGYWVFLDGRWIFKDDSFVLTERFGRRDVQRR